MTKKRARKIRLPRSVRRLFPQVNSAVDADHAIEVSVKATDCKTAKRLDPKECALARATKREMHADGVIIGMSSSYIIKGNKAVRFATPESVRREIVSFDRHDDFEPGDYYLTPKSPSTRLGVEHPTGGRGGGHKAKRRVQHKSVRIRILPKGSTIK